MLSCSHDLQTFSDKNQFLNGFLNYVSVVGIELYFLVWKEINYSKK